MMQLNCIIAKAKRCLHLQRLNYFDIFTKFARNVWKKKAVMFWDANTQEEPVLLVISCGDVFIDPWWYCRIFCLYGPGWIIGLKWVICLTDSQLFVLLFPGQWECQAGSEGWSCSVQHRQQHWAEKRLEHHPSWGAYANNTKGENIL